MENKNKINLGKTKVIFRIDKKSNTLWISGETSTYLQKKDLIDNTIKALKELNKNKRINIFFDLNIIPATVLLYLSKVNLETGASFRIFYMIENMNKAISNVEELMKTLPEEDRSKSQDRSKSISEQILLKNLVSNNFEYIYIEN